MSYDSNRHYQNHDVGGKIAEEINTQTSLSSPTHTSFCVHPFGSASKAASGTKDMEEQRIDLEGQ